jgi:hypothetical protein
VIGEDLEAELDQERDRDEAAGGPEEAPLE